MILVLDFIKFILYKVLIDNLLRKVKFVLDEPITGELGFTVEILRGDSGLVYDLADPNILYQYNILFNLVSMYINMYININKIYTA